MTRPGISASRNVSGLLPEEAYNTPVPVSLIANQPAASGDTGTINVNIGPEFLGRIMLVSWSVTRNVTTGIPSGESLLINGQSYPFLTSIQTAIGYLYHAYVIVSGTSMTVRATVINGAISRLTVWALGTSIEPGQIVEEALNEGSTTNAVTIPFRSGLLTPDTQIIGLTGFRPSAAETTVAESWLNKATLDEASHRGEVARFEFSYGKPPSGATSITIPASDTSRGKTGRLWQVRKRPERELPIRLNDSNLKYHFTSDQGCFRDSEKILKCVDGDPVAVWKNNASNVDASQSEAPRRPIFRTDGANGKPYLDCIRDQKRFFDDLLDLPQAAGSTGSTNLTVTLVAHFYDNDQRNPILGDSGNVYKSAFDIETSGRIRFYRSSNDTLNPIVPVNQPVVITARLRSFSTVDFLVNGVFRSVALSGSTSSAGQSVTQFLRSTGSLGECYFHGRLYEIFINHDTPGIEQYSYQPLHRFLMQKYGISLPT